MIYCTSSFEVQWDQKNSKNCGDYENFWQSWESSHLLEESFFSTWTFCCDFQGEFVGVCLICSRFVILMIWRAVGNLAHHSSIVSASYYSEWSAAPHHNSPLLYYLIHYYHHFSEWFVALPGWRKQVNDRISSLADLTGFLSLSLSLSSYSSHMIYHHIHSLCQASDRLGGSAQRAWRRKGRFSVSWNFYLYEAFELF